MLHILPELGYSFDALEPFIDAKTMEIHHGKHHQGYVDKLNKALEGTGLENKPIKDLLKDIYSLHEDKRRALINNGGGHVNHSFFWPLLKKDVKPSGEILEEINKKFGSLEKFQEEFKNAATTLFGSGWAWLVISNGELEILQTKNQNSPISEGKIPVLGLDLWEHAYYLKYQNKRPDYVDAFFSIINWEQVNENFLKAIK
jgi:Fe-Mn family superoxide dismutase